MPATIPVARDLDAIREHYLAVRKINFEWQTQIIRILGKTAIEHCAKRLGLMHHGTLVCNAESEANMLFDYMIYDYRDRDGRNAVQRFFRQNPPAQGTLEAEVAQAMRPARFRAITVEAVDPGVGLEVRDIFTDQRFYVADVNFSQHAPVGAALAGRFIHLADFSATTGATVPLWVDTLQIVRDRLNQRPFDFDSDPAAFSELFIRAAIESGSTEGIDYADA